MQQKEVFTISGVSLEFSYQMGTRLMTVFPVERLYTAILPSAVTPAEM